MVRRSYGDGSVYRNPNGSGWIASYELPQAGDGRRRRRKRKRRTEAEAKAAIESADFAEAPAGEAAEVVKIVGDKTFVYRDAVWTDTVFDPSRVATQKVGFGGEAYFDVLAARPDMGAYFALGDRVIVVVDGTAYEVTETDSGSIVLPPTPTPRPLADEWMRI